MVCYDRLTEIVFISAVCIESFCQRSQGLGPLYLMNCCECHKIYARDHESLFMSTVKEKRGLYFAQIDPNSI